MAGGYGRKDSLPIFQYSIDGKFIQEHPSQSQAISNLGKKQGTGSTISANLSGATLTAHGFIWFTESQDEPVFQNTERFVNHKV